MLRRLRPVLFVGLVVGLVVLVHELPGPAPDSYAYVTAAYSTSHCVDEHCHWRCELYAHLPRTPLRHRPSGPQPELLKNAVTVHEIQPDSAAVCGDTLHTWIGANFDGDHPSNAHLVLPDPGVFSMTAVVEALVLGVLIYAIWDRLQKRKRAKAGPAAETARAP